MKKILVVTHGKLAGGVVDTVKMLTGDNANLHHIDAYVDSKDFSIEAEQFLQKNQQNPIVVMTDLYGGSVNQRFAQLQTQYTFHLVTGFNLPLVLEILLSDEALTDDLLNTLINQSQQEMRLVTLISHNHNNDNDFFTE